MWGVIFLMFSLSYGQTLNGVIKDTEGNPVKGANVTLKSNPYLTTITDENGNFSLKTGVIKFWLYPSVTGIFTKLEGNKIIIQSEKDYPVSVEIYNYRGEKLTGKTFLKLDRENGLLKIPTISTGFYVLKITINNKTQAIRKLFTGEKSLVVKKGVVNRIKSNTTYASSKEGEDTLVVNADGYLLAEKPISLSSSQEEIVMTKSTQWIPTGSEELEKSGSLVKIKAKGRNFTMGSRISIASEVNDEDYNIECPAHTVSFTYDFWMDTTEVTQKQFVDVMKSAYEEYTSNWSDSYGRGDNIAAYMVSMYEAILYCNARSKLENLDTVYYYEKRRGDSATVKGKPGILGDTLVGLVIDCSKNGYRLPTEAEWEYACKGGTTTDFYWGKNFRPYPVTKEDTAEVSEYALWYGNANIVGTESPMYAFKSGVASKKPNKYGLYDMIGGASEWLHIPINYVLYSEEEVIDPKPTTDPEDIYIVNRTPHWGCDIPYLRSSSRRSPRTNYEHFTFGFRTVREVKEENK